jgi:hypothetical protein
MQNKHEQEEDAGRPNEFRIGLEEMAVAIDGIATKENLKITREMTEDEQKHHQTGHGHYVFLAE